MSNSYSHYVWPVGIISFFLCLAAFYAFYVIPLALEEGSSSVTENPYQDANAYQGIIDREKKASLVGLDKAEIEIKKVADAAEGAHRVVVTIPDVDAIWFEGFKDARLTFSFTSTDVFDFETALVKRGEHSLEANITLPRSGLWMLELRVRSNDGTALVRRRQMIQ